MFAITAITGQVGGAVARHLLSAGQSVRGIVRNPDKAAHWTNQGCEIVIADMNDAQALASAFAGAEAVFILLPPTFDPSIGFPEARRTINNILIALTTARPSKVVCLSTIGANCPRPNLLNQLGILEHELKALSISTAFLRAAWFMENCRWDVASAMERGVIHSFLQPLDKQVPMISTEDVGRVAAELLQERWDGERTINLEGIRRISPNDIATSFSAALGTQVRAEAVPRDTWQSLFISQGMTNPEPRIQMLDGFNQGWIEFEDEAESRTGTVTIDDVLAKLIRQAYRK